MKWRYQNLRIILNRPFLLNLVYRGSQIIPNTDDLLAVETCRALARQTIYDITSEFSHNQMSGWNAVWFLYQASMIPLVSIFSGTWNAAEVGDWCGQIETVLDGLTAMAEWSLSARRSREVVAKVYEASKGHVTRQKSPRTTNGHNTGNAPVKDHLPCSLDQRENSHQERNLDKGENMFDDESSWDLDGMLWGRLPSNLDAPFDGVPDMGL